MTFTKKFSIVIATLNAERTLDKALAAIRTQVYPQNLVEVLVVDGGSSDGTREIARSHGCRIVENPKVEPVNAKLLGLREAVGDYLIYCDADEVMEDPKALQKRALAFQSRDVRIVFAQGYKSPRHATFVNRYINEFGDPFSMFYYRLSKDCDFFPDDIRRTADLIEDQIEYSVYELKRDSSQPIMENAALCNAIDLRFFRQNYPDLVDKPWGPVHFFYHMQDRTKKFAITKNDAVIHYSSDTWRGFLRKIRWRITNNIFSVAGSGFLGRERHSQSSPLRKYIFVPYVILVVPVLVDSARYALTRRDWRYLGIVPLCFFTVFWIVLYQAMKIIGYRPPARGYGV